MYPNVFYKATHLNTGGFKFAERTPLCNQAGLNGGKAKTLYTTKKSEVTCKRCLKTMSLQALVAPAA